MLRLLITDKVEEGEGRIQNCYDIENPDIFNNFVMFTCLINKESVWTCSNIKELYSFNQLYRESKLPNIVCVKKNIAWVYEWVRWHIIKHCCQQLRQFFRYCWSHCQFICGHLCIDFTGSTLLVLQNKV